VSCEKADGPILTIYTSYVVIFAQGVAFCWMQEVVTTFRREGPVRAVVSSQKIRILDANSCFLAQFQPKNWKK